MKFRKKPVAVEAFQWTGDLDALRAWCADLSPPFPGGVVSGALLLETVHGELVVCIGDWIVLDGGEYHSCKPDIFAATHEAAE